MTELIEIIKSRRSVRLFKDKNIPEDIIKKIIEAAIWAPSACNMQDWKFIIIKNTQIKKRIYELGGSINIKNAPICICVCYDNRTDNVEYKDDIQSAAASIQNILLRTHELNLGACWINHLPKKKDLRKLLKIPSCFDPVGAIVLGYPKVEPRPMPRKLKIKEYYNFDYFNFKLIKPVAKKKSKIRRFARKVYYHLPNFLKKAIRKDVEKFVKKFAN
jgi:nitroreductase